MEPLNRIPRGQDTHIPVFLDAWVQQARVGCTVVVDRPPYQFADLNRVEWSCPAKAEGLGTPCLHIPYVRQPGPESDAGLDPGHGRTDHAIPQCRTAAREDGSCEEGLRRYYQLGQAGVVGILHGHPYGVEAIAKYQMFNGRSRVVGQEKGAPTTSQESKKLLVVQFVMSVETLTSPLATGGVGRIDKQGCTPSPTVQQRWQKGQGIPLGKGDPRRVRLNGPDATRQRVRIPARSEALTVFPPAELGPRQEPGCPNGAYGSVPMCGNHGPGR